MIVAGRTLETHLNKKQIGGWVPFLCFLKPNFGCALRSAASWDLPLGAWVAGGVCFGLGKNCRSRICPRPPATTDLLALAGTRRWEVQEREYRRCISSADSGSAE
jgi:hypothetical protein